MKLIITDEELELNPIVPESDVKIPEIVNSVGTGHGSRDRISPLTKELAILEATFGEKSMTEIAKIHNISKQSVSRLVKDPPDEVKEKINNRRELISSTIQEKLIGTLEMFEPEKLNHSQLPYAINQLASSFGRMEQIGITQGSNVQYIIYAPQVRKEEDYKVIDIGDQ